ncbi:MAG TPA: outer membrane protein assembly factor BamA [Humidesulfovibrio sp.]|uniref:outer membrane protein assembly factor BamA n=1 Tax=Humidesulfovibrio sp. TaxID=2910988 RepID=UPI002C9DB3AE|nr:outer membrane protein assembly factor BamA [Humidesulfovibrio sp.]HWR03756.1 outer membrane protein assembly factor BamA [Humidesulfovibrio sp.]
MPRGRKTKFFALAVLALALAVFATPRQFLAAVTSPREVSVVVLPFEVNAGDDLKYLRQGLQDMLSERLSDAGFTVISRDALEKALASKGLRPTDPQAAKEGALLTGATYAITGSFSQLGETLSLDVRVSDPFGLKLPVPVSVSKDGLINLLPAVDELVAKMKGDLMGLDRIVDIEVEGTVALDREVVLMRMATKKGDTLDFKTINADVKTVYDLGYFDDVKALLRDASGGKKLIVRVVEKPRILAIGVKGAKEMKSEDILKVANSKKGAVLNPKVLTEDMAAIREIYRKDGFYNAKVTHEIETAGQGQARLNFVIDEGKKLYIKKIVIQGAKQLPEDELKGELAVKERGLFSWFTQSGVLKEELLERDSSALAAYYNNRGFIDAKVGAPEVAIGEDGITITFKVEEGPRFKVESVRVEGDLIADEPKLIALTKTSELAKEKGFLDRSMVRDDLKALTDYYNNFGYAYAEANVRMNDHPEEKSVDIIFVMRKLQKVHIRRVLIEGNTKTRDNVILREMRLADGSQFNGEKLKRSSERLDKLGYFSSVDIEPVPTGNPDEMDLKVKVKDKDTGKIGGGVGYSTYDSVYLAASVEEANLFGKGWSSSLNGQWGAKKTAYTFTAMNPRWDDSNLGVGFQLFDRKEDYVAYNRDSLGGKINFSYPVGEYTSLLWDYRLERYKIYDVDTTSASQIVLDSIGTHTASVASATLLRDTTNGGSTTLPSSGTVNSLTFMYGGGALFGSDNFIKGIYDNSWYHPVVGDLVFKWHGQVGWVGKNLSSDEIPITERFALGGSGTVRGYSQRKITPLQNDGYGAVYGDKEAFANLELTYPMSKKMGIYGIGFFDAGNTWKEGEGWFSNPKRGGVMAPSFGLYKSVGLGILWYSPMGPLKIEYGHGLDNLYDSSNNKVEFNMGRTF